MSQQYKASAAEPHKAALELSIMKNYLQITCAFALTIGLLLCRAAVAAPTYALTDLGALVGNAPSDGIAINESGSALLSAQDAYAPSVTHYYMYANGSLVSLGNLALPGSDNGGAVAIADNGLIAGTAQAYDGAHAFLDIGYVLTDLGNLGGTGGASASDLNTSGHVIGWSDNGVNQSAYLYENGRMSGLAGLSGDLSGPSFAYGINESDQVVGEAEFAPAGVNSASVSHAVLWQRGGARDLGSLAGQSGSSDAWAINDIGQIVGTSDTASGNRHAFFLAVNGAMQDIGTLGGLFSFAEAINNNGQVVGQAAIGQNDINGTPITHAFLWQHGSMTDLNTLLPASSGWVLSGAFGINANGQIVGTGIHTAYGVSTRHAFLMTAAAAPWTAASISVGGDGGTRILWTKSNGTASIWTINSGGEISYGPSYGPFSGWTPRKIVTGADNKTRIWWTNANGSISYWTVDAAGGIAYSPTYGRYSGWTAMDIAIGPDAKTRILWTNPSGAISIWTVSAAGAVTYSPTYGPYSGWTALGISVGGDDKTRVLWGQPNGAMSYWTIDPQNRTVYSPIYGPYSGWAPKGISTGADNSNRIMWSGTDGSTSFWTINGYTPVIYSPKFGPYAGWNANCLAVGPDAQTRILWNGSDNGASFWTVAHGNAVSYSPTYGPFNE